MTAKNENKRDVILVRSADHKSHYIIGAIPQWTRTDLRLHMYNEIIEGEDEPYFVTTTQIIIPKAAVGKLLEVLANAMKNEGKATSMKVMELPPELSKVLESERTERKPPRKKVQKIRRK